MPDADSIKASATTAIAWAKTDLLLLSIIMHLLLLLTIHWKLLPAFDKVGVSHLLCYEISDCDGMAIAKQVLMKPNVI